MRCLIGVIRTPRETFAAVIRNPRWLGAAGVIVTVSAVCSAGFLLTRVGELAALDQQVRQLESFGAEITDYRYEQLRRLVPYRPAISAAGIIIGWPLLWFGLAAVVQRIGSSVADARPTFTQVLAVIVHASAVLMLREIVSAPLHYARESLGGATSVSLLLPSFGDSTFPARLLGAIDLFVVWWVVLIAMALGMLYRARAVAVARWLFGAYATGAALVALVQAFRGGV